MSEALLGTPGGSRRTELRMDTVRVWRLPVQERTLLPGVQVQLDGLGSGAGNQRLRPVLYDAAGVLMATGEEIVVPDGSGPAMYSMRFADATVLAPSDYLLGLHVGPPSRSARLYGDTSLGMGAENACVNPVLGTNASGWFARMLGGTGGAIARITTDRAIDPDASGSNAFQATWAAGAELAENCGIGFGSATSGFYEDCEPGDRCFVRFIVKNEQGVFANVTVRGRFLREDGTFLTDVVCAGPRATNVATVGEWKMVEGVCVAPPDAARLTGVVAYSGSSNAVGATIELRGGFCQLEVNPQLDPPPMVLGSMPGDQWNGTPHASRSRGNRARVVWVLNPRPRSGGSTLGPTQASAAVESDSTSPTGRRIRLHTPLSTAGRLHPTAQADTDKFLFGALPGETWTLAAYVKVNQQLVDTNSGGQLYMAQSGGSTTRSPAPVTADAGKWLHRRISRVLQDERPGLFVRLYNGGSGAAEAHFARILLFRGSEGDQRDFEFDGDYADAVWAGASGNSVSVRYRPAADFFDTFADGPSAQLPVSAATVLPGALAFVDPVPPWEAPNVPDEELATGWGWQSTQQALRGAIDTTTETTVTAEWHGTNVDERRGAVALVRESGPLEEWVGERIRVLNRRGGREAFVVVVASSDDMDEDLSLSRRAWMAIANPSAESAKVRVGVVQSATS